MARVFVVIAVMFGSYVAGLAFLPHEFQRMAFGIGGFGVSWLLIGTCIAGIVAYRNT